MSLHWRIDTIYETALKNGAHAARFREPAGWVSYVTSRTGVRVSLGQGSSGGSGRRRSFSFRRKRSRIILDAPPVDGLSRHICADSIAVYDAMLADHALMAKISQLSTVATEAVRNPEEE